MKYAERTVSLLATTVRFDGETAVYQFSGGGPVTIPHADLVAVAATAFLIGLPDVSWLQGIAGAIAAAAAANAGWLWWRSSNAPLPQSLHGTSNVQHVVGGQLVDAFGGHVSHPGVTIPLDHLTVPLRQAASLNSRAAAWAMVGAAAAFASPVGKLIHWCWSMFPWG